MFFNKDKKIGRDLASYAIMLPEKQIQQIDEIMQDTKLKFSAIEYRRLRLCLSILNLASIFWWVNFSEHMDMGIIDNNRVKKIIDNMLDAFMNEFINDNTTVRIGDYVVDNEEIMLINREWSWTNTTMETKTNIGTLVPTIYNIRIGQYDAAITERLKLFSGRKEGSLDPVVKLFVKHFVGKTSSEHLELVLLLSCVLTPFDEVISTIVGDYINSVHR